MQTVFELGQEFVSAPGPDGLRAWQARMGFGYDSAAEALGISRSTYGLMLAGNMPGREVSRSTPVDRCTALACVAIEAGLSPFSPVPLRIALPVPAATKSEAQKPTASLFVKRRSLPMQVVIVALNARSGRTGKVLVSEPIRSDFSMRDLAAAARRLVPQVPGYSVIFPVGVEL